VTAPTPPPGALPGSQIWNGGASSFLFGTNDSYEWSDQNLQTMPSVQLALRNAGFTLVRTFIPDNADDATLELRIKTVENIGARCLAVLTNVANATFNEHVVSYFGNRCQLYEFGNEPDYYGPAFDQYMSAWNAVIPQLRRINPSAKFIGPGVINATGFDNYLPRFLQGVKTSGVLPDAISIHYYPCWHMDEPTCLASASTYASTAEKVRGFVRSILGKDLPIGFTEWNYDPRNPPPSYGSSADFISQFTVAAIKSMISGGVSFACQFDAASFGGYGRLDMFDVKTGLAKPQFDALLALIKHYKPAAGSPPATLGPTLLSQSATIMCSSNNTGPGGDDTLTDGKFGAWGFWELADNSLPGSCAFHLTHTASNVVLAWFSDYSFDYTDSTSLAPQDYDIEVSKDSTTGSDGTWTTVASVRGNHARAREHLFGFAGMSWIRMTVLAAQPQPTQPYVRIDELEIFDAKSLGTDTFFFSGDSITGMAYNRYAENTPSFADDMVSCAPKHYPLMIDGGFGGQTSAGAVEQIDSWQALLPDMHYWLLGWGSNDALNDISPEVFRANLQTLVTAILQRGGVPILAHIPYTTYHNLPGLDAEVQRLNQVIDDVTTTNSLIPGPDLYALVRAHRDYLGPDGLHPSSAGSVAINALWFQTLRSNLGLGAAHCN
jgi:lysophospholipase L1-like esterase